MKWRADGSLTPLYEMASCRFGVVSLVFLFRPQQTWDVQTEAGFWAELVVWLPDFAFLTDLAILEEAFETT